MRLLLGGRHGGDRCRQGLRLEFFELDLATDYGVNQLVVAQHVQAAGGRGIEDAAACAGRIRGDFVHFFSRGHFLGHLFLFFLGAVVEPRVVQPRGQFGNFFVVRRRVSHGAARLLDLEEVALPQGGDLCPRLNGRFDITTLNRIDDNPFLQRRRHDLGVLHLVVVHVRRRVADQEDHLVRLVLFAPRHVVHGIVERLVDTLGRVAATVCLEVHQRGIDGIEVIGQVDNLGHVGIATVAVRDEPNANVGRLLGR